MLKVNELKQSEVLVLEKRFVHCILIITTIIGGEKDDETDECLEIGLTSSNIKRFIFCFKK